MRILAFSTALAGLMTICAPAQANPGAPLKGVDVKSGKDAGQRCSQAPSPQASPPTGTVDPSPAECTSPPSPAPEAQATKATKTRSNIQNN